MKKLALAFALPLGGALLIQAGAANAVDVTVNVGGTDYTISTYTGTLNDILTDPLFDAPLFADADLAEALSDAVNSQTGVAQTVTTELGDIDLGPLFAWTSFGDNYAWYNDGGNSLYFEFDPSGTYTYAVINTPAPAAPTPGPLPLLGAAAAFSASRRLRHRISAQTFKL